MQLDEDKLEALRRWGQGLQQVGDEASAAAGRAILMLIAEIEQLQIDLELVREQLSRVEPASSDEDEAAESAEEPEPVASTLQERLQRVLKRDSDSSPRAEPPPAEESELDMGTDRTTASEQAWIEGLRRHK